MSFIIEHFSIFFSFINQIDQFLCHWTCKLQGYKVKEQPRKHKKRMSDSLFLFFWKNNWRPFSSSSPISSSLFLCTILILILYRGWKKAGSKNCKCISWNLFIMDTSLLKSLRQYVCWPCVSRQGYCVYIHYSNIVA
jgi:hypothetical protein